jgi:hypothetical protein
MTSHPSNSQTVFESSYGRITRGRRRILLTSALIPSNDAFDEFVEHLPEQN